MFLKKKRKKLTELNPNGPEFEETHITTSHPESILKMIERSG